MTSFVHEQRNRWTMNSNNFEPRSFLISETGKSKKKTFPKDAIFLLVRHIKLFEINIIRQRGKSVYPDSREREDESCCSLSRFPADELFLNTLRNLLWTFPNSIFTRSIELQNKNWYKWRCNERLTDWLSELLSDVESENWTFSALFFVVLWFFSLLHLFFPKLKIWIFLGYL